MHERDFTEHPLGNKQDAARLLVIMNDVTTHNSPKVIFSSQVLSSVIKNKKNI
jgi:hypothetical protein